MLYLCPTPIGNLQDVTLRVLEVLGSVEVVACEDTRRTRVLLERHGVQAKLLSFHDHNEEQRLATLLPLLRQGKDIAVVSDAGMPGLSDPGFSLVRACAIEDLPVTVLPGPSVISTALVLSGLPCDRFAFVGFLARSRTKLVQQISVFDGTGAAVVAFDSPRRLRGSLAIVAEEWPERRLAVCRELTKLHEEVLRGTAAEILKRLPEAVRGEITLVVEPRESRLLRAAKGKGTGGVKPAVLDETALSALKTLIEAGIGVKKASGVVAELTGIPSRRLYEACLGLRGCDGER